MKKNNLIKYLLFFAFIVNSNVSKSQGNLQFNQVLTFADDIFGSDLPVGQGITHTVPTGKVWKVESMSTTCCGSNGSANLYVNNKIVGYFNSVNLSYSNIEFPIWLKAGDIIAFGRFSGSNTSFYNGLISIIEYNIVP